MKKLIKKSLFNALIKNNKVYRLTSKNIKEFKIGKSYFYEVIEYPELKTYHDTLNKILHSIDLNNSATAFRKNCSYLHLFEPHRNNYNFLRLDIKSFFHSFKISDIENAFKPYIDDTEKIDRQTLLNAFINTITYKIPKKSENEPFKNTQVLPMGFKTSPIISNIVFRKLDIIIQKVCSQHNIIYSRYADDMLFSSVKENTYIHSNSFIKDIEVILSKMNFKLNTNKTIKAKHTLSLNGYTIQYSLFQNNDLETKINEVRLSNKKTNQITKMIYLIKQKNKPSVVLKKALNYKLTFQYVTSRKKQEEYYKTQLLNKISGYRAYLISIINFHKEYNCCQKDTLNKYNSIIEDLNNIIENNGRYISDIPF